MTLEELYECDADTLLKMTDAELEAHFAPFFHITRPEQATKKFVAPILDPAMQLKIKQLQAMGIEVDANSWKKKR